MNRNQLPELTRETLTTLFTNVGITKVSNIVKPFTERKLRSFHQMILSMTYFNVRYRQNDFLAIVPLFPTLGPYGSTPNTELVEWLFALGLALKELYQMDDIEFKTLLTQSNLF